MINLPMDIESKETANIINGLLLILRYDSLAHFTFEHDVIYFGDELLEMSDEHLKLMEQWGWEMDSNSERWSYWL